MRSSKKKSLIKEQNKGLIMICVTIIIVIGIICLLIYIPNSKSKENTPLIDDNGVVNDLDGIKAKK